jgi:hypothetical protein
MLYQKDGPGPLLRCYLDRIHDPEILNNLQKTCDSKDELSQLTCSKCNQHIGIPMVYEKENRLTYQMIKGSFSKQKIKN